MIILVVCSSGMSSTLVVSRMMKVVKEQQKDYQIMATSVDCAEDYFDIADIILLGPQIADYETYMKEKSGKMVAVMNRLHYGRCRGDLILQESEEAYQVYKEKRG